jgi:hypothetical protein
MTGGRAWRKAFSHLLKGLGPLKPASLGKLPQGIKTVFAVSISRENLSGIVRWAFISLHWCPVKYFSLVDKSIDMRRIKPVLLKNDLN